MGKAVFGFVVTCLSLLLVFRRDRAASMFMALRVLEFRDAREKEREYRGLLVVLPPVGLLFAAAGLTAFVQGVLEVLDR